MLSFNAILSLLALATSVVAVPLEPEISELEKKSADASDRFTWFYVSAGTTACGGNYPDSAYVVALNQPQWAGGSHCGQQVSINVGGKTHSATIVDLCPGCPSGGLDMSQAVFDYFTWPGAAGSSTDPGVIYGSWSYA